MAIDLAIDLGSTTTSVAVRGRREYLIEPSVVTREVATGTALAVGRMAAEMVGRTPIGIETVHPIRGGVIVDEQAARALVAGLVRRAGVGRFRRIRAVVCVPTGLTAVERRAVLDVVRSAGVAEVRLLGHTMAAALGCRLPVDQPIGSLVVDLGGGKVEAAVLSLGGVVALEWRTFGGLDLDREVRAAVERDHGLVIDLRSAESAKLELGWAAQGGGGGAPVDLRSRHPVRGRHVESGVAGQVDLSASEIADAIHDPVRAVVDVVTACVGWAPPEIAHDLLAGEGHLVGGMAQLPGLAPLVADLCRLPVRAVEEADRAVIRGAARCLGRLAGLEDVFLEVDTGGAG